MMKILVREVEFNKPLQRGVCARYVSFKIRETVSKDYLKEDEHHYYVSNIVFKGGCQGNLSFISKLFEGKPVQVCIADMKGHKCGNRSTSCVDQFAKALEEAFEAFF